MTELPAHFRRLESLAFAEEAQPSSSTGEVPKLCWVKLDQLVIDGRYQREIMGRGRRNIKSIVEEFDWTRFTPVIVAPVDAVTLDDGRTVYAVIDGQHRATGAVMHPAIGEVPCQIVHADLSGQAIAFMKINSVVTLVSSLQLHAAALNGEDPDAIRLDELCLECDVLIMRYPVPANKMQGGQTLAIGALHSVYKQYGAEILTAALHVLRNADPFGGLVNAHTIKGMAMLLKIAPKWMEHMELVQTIIDVKLLKAVLARAKTDRMEKRGTIATHLSVRLQAALEIAVRNAA